MRVVKEAEERRNEILDVAERLRASMGHPEPFKMTYLEIGNENWGPDYEKR